MKIPEYSDLKNLSEDERITLIGRAATVHKKIIGVIVDDQKKADRYIKKLTAQFPDIEIISQFPLAGSITIKVGPKKT